jgi:transposase-like protein
MKTRTEAIQLFGTVAEMARALDVTHQAIYAWPEQLKQYHIDRVIGAAIRTGKLPKRTRTAKAAA